MNVAVKASLSPRGRLCTWEFDTVRNGSYDLPAAEHVNGVRHALKIIKRLAVGDP